MWNFCLYRALPRSLGVLFGFLHYFFGWVFES